MLPCARWKLYASDFWRQVEKHYHIQLARGATGEPAPVFALSLPGREILYYISGWMVRATAKTSNDIMIKTIMKEEQITIRKAIQDGLPVGCIRRRRPEGGGTYISNDMFTFFLQLEDICRGFATPINLRRLRVTFASTVMKYAASNTDLHRAAVRLVKKYKFPTEGKKRLSKTEVAARVDEAARQVSADLVKRYMPLRTEEALRWLMEDIGVRKSDAGAIRSQLREKAGSDIKTESQYSTESSKGTESSN